MKKLLLITSIAFASMAAAPAGSKGTTLASTEAQGPAQQASDIGPATATAPAAEEKKICKLLPSSGTRFTKRACLTEKEWKQVDADFGGDNGY